MVAACKEPSRQLDTPIGTTAVELDSRSTTVRSRETAIGALIADAMRWSAQTEVAMTNGGVSVPKIRFYSNGDEVRRGQA